ncbi:HD domain-containing protein [Clostridium botulinum]|uniref:5'-deoxynucleotidase n=1 Tax=Clostridium botulinum (strain Okra / Type B1) TaxID=498213 RepID=B1ILC9_CLOBK|nr:HD domain-containing protein [Clostridium botulinum]EKX78339.1 HD domain-containing protein [Clostridium botulinum CFSAN001628]ACA45339.1 HD domain protein [Clostridium botulinum B1 str. Okra]MBD5564347.1 HD domain-containing protein [Clostridium botulinum]MBD5566092.1 HD domain-containing protein [Clostridium botulinum]MBD5569392.1 HD domain-containing protein [Clostridium botulinum]
MYTKQLIKFMSIAEKLKNNTRHSWTSDGRQESVAEHSWRLSLMAYLVKDEYPDADINKVILMCICHDLGEAITGDIPAFYKTESDEIVESNAVVKLLDSLPQPYKSELIALFKEMDEQQTLESKIYKALDKMETLIQHNEADLSTWIPLEYEVNLSYGAKEAAFSNYMKKLKETIYEDSIQKIQTE